jgi:hypothetical protein
MQIQNAFTLKQFRFEFGILNIGICLELGIRDLEFFHWDPTN